MENTIWNLDASHSTIGFTVRHMVFAKVRGRFTRFTGSLSLAGDDWSTGAVEVEIDAASIDTAEPKRDGHLKSPDFFDVEKFPKLSFKSKRVAPVSARELQVIGDLTLHGVTREVTLEVEYEGAGKDPWGGERKGFTARASIDRTDFGLTWNQALETGGLLVGHRIELNLEVEAVRAQAKQAA